MVEPHGGKLINQVLENREKQEILNRENGLKTLVLSMDKVIDAKNIAFGVYSPITGFLKQKDFESVVSNMRLANGTVWPIPITLDISEQEKKQLKNEKEILLVDAAKKPIALLTEIDLYTYNKDSFAKNVFGTTDINHPGVSNIYGMGDVLLGGTVKLVDDSKDDFPEYNLTPQETRAIFQKNNWNTVAAFQTRNVPHRGHEFLQKRALDIADGLLVQPVIGEKKLADFKDEFIMGAYRLLLDNFYPKDRALLSILPLKMRYAGPREALMHAIIRKNFGCSHFIVGRDHAGVGDFYGPYDAQNIFNDFTKNEIGVEILKFNNVVWCKECNEFVFEGSCNHKVEQQVSFSGSKIRQCIEKKEQVPEHFMRPEVYHLLSHSLNPLVDHSYNLNKNNNGKGFVLWFTGLSGSGKSTVANAVFKKLKGRGTHVERLDGDIVRKSLTKDLGFSKEDRDENIKRVGFVASSLSHNGVVVLASFISPYKEQRDNLRSTTENFIEVFCSAPLSVCEERDVKGLYKKARSGEIKDFTGVSAPYETPESPEITIDTSQQSTGQSASQVLAYLKSNNLI